MVTYGDLFTFVIMLCAVTTLVRCKSRPDNITLYDTLDKYIRIKEGVLSPPAIRTHKSGITTKEGYSLLYSL